MSNQTILDAGQPPPPVTVTQDEDGNPVVSLAAEGSDEYNASLRHANATVAVAGTTASPTAWGTYLRRVGTVLTGVTVSANQCTVGPGVVHVVQATTGLATGAKTRILVGSPTVSEVLLQPQADGTVLLTFSALAGITACAVYLLPSSASLISALDAAADPPE